jgi:anti-sigma B factor antagonist
VNIKSEDRGAYTYVQLEGRFDGGGADRVPERLQDLLPGPGGVLAIDLSGVDMLDSSGLGLLVDLTARARMREARVVLVAPSPFIQGVLKVTKLDTWLEVVGDLTKLRVAAQ